MRKLNGDTARTPEQLKATKHLWYLKNREISIARAKTHAVGAEEWRQAHRPQVNALAQARRQTPEGRDKKEHDSLMRRFSNHGLTLDQYHAMIEQQEDCCAICGSHPSDNYGGFHDGYHIDHQHVTEKIRGLLCKHCNIGIGMLKDSPQICRAAAAYLSA